MPHKDSKVVRPVIDVAPLAARFMALHTEQQKYFYLDSFNFPVDAALRKALDAYWPWTGPLRGNPDVIVKLDANNWKQAALNGSI